jgi:hypothetical protein
MVARRIGHDLHPVKRRPTKEVATPVLRSMALKGTSDTSKEAPQNIVDRSNS